MNLLYQTLFPASLLPRAILALFYLVHGYIPLFLISAIHIATHVVVIVHEPVKPLTMERWNRLLQLQRLVLWFIYALRPYPIISLIIFLTIGINVKLTESDKVTSNIIHAFLVLNFCSTASISQCFVALSCLLIYHVIKLPVNNQWNMRQQIEKYFQIRMAYNYMFAIVEWSVSDMNFLSLPFIIFVCVLFNACVFFNIPEDNSVQDEWYQPKQMTADYPYPLNIKDAMERCNVAKKLFKSHEL